MTLDTSRYTAILLRRAPDSRQVVWGSVVTYGLVRELGQLDDGAGGFLPQTARTLLVARSALAGIGQNATVTIGGAAFDIRSPALPVENGELVRYVIAPA